MRSSFEPGTRSLGTLGAAARPRSKKTAAQQIPCGERPEKRTPLAPPRPTTLPELSRRSARCARWWAPAAARAHPLVGGGGVITSKEVG